MWKIRVGITVACALALVSCGQPVAPAGTPNVLVSAATDVALPDTAQAASDQLTSTNVGAVTTVTLPLIFNSTFANSIFGVETTSITGTELSLLQQSGASWVRRNGLIWSGVEPTEGARNWNSLGALEQEMITASNNGLHLILVVRSTPYWAQKNPITPAGPSCGAVDASKFGAYGAFLHDAVARYSVPPYNVKFWEIGNEPDVDPAYFSAPNQDSIFGCMGDRTDPYYGGGHYGQMLQAIYPLIKSANPMAQVLTGGLLLDHPISSCPAGTVGNSDMACFFEGILRSGGAAGFDGVSFHAYDYFAAGLGKYLNGNWQTAWNTTGPVIIRKAHFLKSLIQNYGVTGKYIMVGETALLCGRCTELDPVSQATKAQYLAQLYAAAISEDISAVLYYDMQGSWNQSQLYSSASQDPFHAYIAAQAQLAGMQVLTEVTSYPGVMGYSFLNGSQPVTVLWSLDGATHSVTLPAMPSTLIDYLGLSLSPTLSISVGLQPIFIH